MQNKNPWFLALVVALTGLSIWLYQIQPYAFGLDIKGGARFIYEMDMSELSPEQRERPAEVQSKVKNILENRVSAALGVVEGSVVSRGVDQFIVELPDMQDLEQARALLGTTAKIQVYHAKNVSTPTVPRRYERATQEVSESGSPFVTFYSNTDSSATIAPGDPAYAQIIDGWDLIIEGDEIDRAEVQVSPQGEYQPHFYWSGEGNDKMVQWSRRSNRTQENLAFVLDGTVLNIAPLENGAVLNNTAYINGDFESDYLNTFVDLINSGSLPVKLVELASQTVDPTIGEVALQQMILGGVISLGLICVFLIVYYSFPGVVATVAMILYTLFTLTVLKLMGATFSLAAIAGLILSAGMAVDANILVFERVKEELRAGRKTLTAIELGFRRALTAIVDSNICTILTSLVLWTLGTGPVKGFATTLIIGVLISFFTAITITRSLLVGITGLGKFHEAKWYAVNRSLFGEKLGTDAGESFQIIGKAKKYFIISAILIGAGMIFVAMGGIKPNVEFQGGFEAQYRLDDDNVTVASVRENLEAAGFTGANIKVATADDQRWVYITLPEQESLDFGSNETVNQIAEAAGVPAEDASLQEIGPAIAQETVYNAILAVLISSAIIVIYLAIRFGVALGGMKNGMKFGLSAVAALLHDVAFIVGVAGIVGFALGWEISALFITAMLTVIGFSVHDTIIIFDRMRENLKRAKSGETFEHLMDRSIRQSITRSIITSLTAIFPLAVLLFIGTPNPELKFMILAMLMGIGVGTYSSIFNASPILFLWNKAIMKKKGEQHGLLQEALRENKIRASAALSVAGAGAAPGEADAAAYGTIKRKKSVREQASVELDDDDV